METGYGNASNESVVVQAYGKARKRLAEGEIKESLFAARNALEELVRNACLNHRLDSNEDNQGIDLLSMIDSLKDCNAIDEEQASALHRLRELGNKGVHGTPTKSQAEEALMLLEEAMKFLGRYAEEKDNEPRSGGRYYARGQSYRGKWSNCYSREALMVIPEYVELERDANNGDISAMLNLAVGFLPKEIVWGDHQMVCMPKKHARGREYYNQNAYDTRYYYWIVKACEQANATGKYPKEYMATALLETIKFASFILRPVSYYVTDVHFGRSTEEYQLVYGNQFELVKELYGVDFSDYADAGDLGGQVFSFAAELLRLIAEYGNGIIHPIHQENTEASIKYLAYCMFCFLNYCCILVNESSKLDGGSYTYEPSDVVVWEELALAPEDTGKNVSLELLNRRLPSDVCLPYYQIVEEYVNNAMKELKDMRYAAAHPEEVKAQRKKEERAESLRGLFSRNPSLYEIVAFLGLIPAFGAASAAINTGSYQSIFLNLLCLLASIALSSVQARLQPFIESIPVPDNSISILFYQIYTKGCVVAVALVILIGSFTSTESIHGFFNIVLWMAAVGTYLYFNRHIIKGFRNFFSRKR